MIPTFFTVVSSLSFTRTMTGAYRLSLALKKGALIPRRKEVCPDGRRYLSKTGNADSCSPVVAHNAPSVAEIKNHSLRIIAQRADFVNRNFKKQCIKRRRTEKKIMLFFTVSCKKRLPSANAKGCRLLSLLFPLLASWSVTVARDITF